MISSTIENFFVFLDFNNEIKKIGEEFSQRNIGRQVGLMEKNIISYSKWD